MAMARYRGAGSTKCPTALEFADVAPVGQIFLFVLGNAYLDWKCYYVHVLSPNRDGPLNSYAYLK